MISKRNKKSKNYKKVKQKIDLAPSQMSSLCIKQNSESNRKRCWIITIGIKILPIKQNVPYIWLNTYSSKKIEEKNRFDNFSNVKQDDWHGKFGEKELTLLEPSVKKPLKLWHICLYMADIKFTFPLAWTKFFYLDMGGYL